MGCLPTRNKVANISVSEIDKQKHLEELDKNVAV